MAKLQFVRLILPCILASALMLPVACSPKVDNGGYVREGDVKGQVTVGKSTRDDVQAALGSPSTRSTFGPESWYYITDRKEGWAFLKPEVVEQNVTRIEFDDSGLVSKIDSYSEKDGKRIALVKRTTPTEGHSLGFFEQLLGNIGRFNRPADNNAVPGGRQPGQ